MLLPDSMTASNVRAPDQAARTAEPIGAPGEPVGAPAEPVGGEPSSGGRR
ncbi:MAG: hypothetical protein AVDCRST_MAG36-2146 [uncultured Nocardioidaceae bacterium]|uniref:Uncharacterized protein n=1 Tax=uncultured Nocardioidaceae bacterium TaxID=253824 RepID=A0A6J4MFK1_9ACTN|nr:MAG: hypothetical protein AVDCRST_MAG36-2146 [uncultured Nocardioidaceae bacterium]